MSAQARRNGRPFCERAQRTAPSVKRPTFRSSDPRVPNQRFRILRTCDRVADGCAVQANTSADERLAARPGTIRPHWLGNIAEPGGIVLYSLQKHPCQRRGRSREQAFPAPQSRGLHPRDVSFYFRLLRKNRRGLTATGLEGKDLITKAPWRASGLRRALRPVWETLHHSTRAACAVRNRIPLVRGWRGATRRRDLFTQ